jgi:hypothetical protein
MCEHRRASDEVRAIQSQFFEIISKRLQADDRLPASPDTESLISPNEKLSAHERIELYARQYWWRLMGSLRDDFPISESLLGSKKFRSLIEDYILAHGSRSYTLRHLGRGFPQFLLMHAHIDEAPRMQFAAELAQAELAQLESYFAATLPALTAEMLAELEHPESRLLLLRQPHVFVFSYHYPVLEYVEQHKKTQLRDNVSNATATEQQNAADVPISAEHEQGFAYGIAQSVCIYRYGSAVYAKKICNLSHVLLEQLGRAHSLPELLTVPRVLEELQSPEELSQAFREISSLGLIGIIEEAKI